MLRPFLLLIIITAAHTSRAQSPSPIVIIGNITDSITSKKIAYAMVTLLQGSKTLSTVTADTVGTFTIEGLIQGNVTIQVSYVGYITRTLTLDLTLSETLVNVGTVQLIADKQQLKNVTVTSQKPLVEDKGDRLVYNAEADISNAGGTAADVLRKVPTLTVDLSGNVQMRGNSNIKVLVNGKPSAMMARNLAEALQQMPAYLIKSVEVITNPGARYDAEGAAGVINIITKKGLKGFNGSVNVAAGNINRSLGTTLNLRKKKLSLAFSGTGYQYHNIFENNVIRTTWQSGTPLNILTQKSKSDNTGTGGYGEMGIDYDPDSTTHLNFSANVWGGYYPNNSTILNRLTDPDGLELQAFRNERRFKNPYGNGQLDLGYTKTLKKTDQEFSLLAQFSRMPDNYFYNTDRFSSVDEIIYREQSTNYSRNKEYTIQSDYTHPFIIKGTKDTANMKLEVGAKTIIRDIGSTVSVDQSLDGKTEMVADPSQTNDFDYIQKVFSGYTSLRFNNKRKWNMNAGARMEHTNIQADFRTTATKLNNQYNNLIPSLMISKGIKSQTYKLSYTQRITRPLLWYLNPWVNQSDPKNISTGNPNLEPELNHSTEFAYSISNTKGFSLNSALYWRVTNNAIEYITSVNGDGISLNRPENIAQRKAYGLNINLSSKPLKNWNLNSGADIRYVDLRSPALQQESNGIVWNWNFNTTITLPKEYTLQANGNLSSGWISLQRTNSKWYWYGLSAKHQLWNKKASLTVGVNNIFSKGLRQQSILTGPSFQSENHSLFFNRSIRLSFEWRFGQMNAQGGKQGKKIKNDDSDR
jgi:ferric enterobactin receptor